MVVLKPLSAFNIVCSFSRRLGRTNTSSGVAPGDAISMLPVGHCPDLAPSSLCWPQEDAVLSTKAVGQMGSGWLAFLLPLSLRGELPPENTPAALPSKLCPCRGSAPWLRWGPQMG